MMQIPFLLVLCVALIVPAAVPCRAAQPPSPPTGPALNLLRQGASPLGGLAPFFEAMKLNEKARALVSQGQFEAALPVAERSLALLRSAQAQRPRMLPPSFDPLAPALVPTLIILGRLYVFVGRLNDAEPLFEEALALMDQVPTVEIRERALAFGHFAELHSARGDYEKSLELRERSRRLMRASPNAHAHDIANVDLGIAQTHYLLGDFDEALDVARRSLATYQGSRLPDRMVRIASVNNLLGQILHDMGRYIEAETAMRDFLEITRSHFGPGHQEIAKGLNNLAGLYKTLGRLENAQTLLDEAMPILRAARGSQNIEVATLVHNRGLLKSLQGKAEEAEQDFLEALRITRAELPAGHPFIASTLKDLAVLYVSLSRFEEAERNLLEALSIRQQSFPSGHPLIAEVLVNLGALYQRQDRIGDARRSFEDALAIVKNSLPLDSPAVADAHERLAVVLRKQGQTAAAGQLAREAFAIRRRRAEGGGSWERPHAAEDERRKASLSFRFFVTFGAQARAFTTGEAFIAAQLARARKIEQALALAAARLSGDGEGARLARERQDLIRKKTILEQRYFESIARERPSSLADLRRKRMELDAALQRNRSQLETAHPRYAALVSPRSLGLHDLQQPDGLLKGGEALILFLEGLDAWHAFVITRSSARLLTLETNTRDITDLVRTLRCGLDRSSAATCPPPAQPAPGGSSIGYSFDLEASHRLYGMLFGRLRPILEAEAIDSLLIVPDGPLESLPLDVLVTNDPPQDRSVDDAYRAAEWLSDRFALSILPSVSTLKALRRAAHASRGTTPLIAFADPALAPRASLPDMQFPSPGSNTRSTVCDLSPVRATRLMAETLMRTLGGSEDQVFTGARASERVLRALNQSGALGQARVVAFHTHGLVAGELPEPAAREPALALTPGWRCGDPLPRPFPEDNDGLLTLSDVLDLRLDADWALLTACNTAAPDGTPGAAALSGLARGFFFAGARALLVSHWPARVENDPTTGSGPTEMLLEAFFSRRENASTKAAALAAAKKAVRASHPHPALWAPFSLIGDGNQPLWPR